VNCNRQWKCCNIKHASSKGPGIAPEVMPRLH
jgi:hypothetical protein